MNGNGPFEYRNPLFPDTLQNVSGPDFFALLIPRLIALALTVAAVVFFFMMVLGGIAWITGGGDKAQLESARSRITHAVIGIFIVLSVFAIIKLVETFFGISILTLDIGKLRVP